MDKWINKIHCMDCLEGMKQFPDESVDLIVTDPPYGINHKSNYGSAEHKERLYNFDWDKDFDFRSYFFHHFRILKPNSYMFVFGRIENFNTMQSIGFDRLLIWDKGHSGMGDLLDWGIGYEFIYVFKKGRPHLRGGRVNGVIDFMHIGYFDKTIHPTQKPVGLIRFLIEKCSDVGHIVFDGFMGSGTTAVACKQLNRNFIGFELEPKYVEIANKRLQQQTLHSTISHNKKESGE